MNERLAVFEQHRLRLIGIAYRMLGSLDDAQDIVQDAFLRWHSADFNEIQSPGAWLTTVCTRLALNRLSSAQVERTQYVGAWLPEPLPPHLHFQPNDALEADETVSSALLLALECLTPHERASYLLHEVFDYPFSDIADILGLSLENCRQLASRARKHVQIARPRFTARPDELNQLLEGFTKAARNGDLPALLAVLAPNVVLTADGGGKAQTISEPLCGAEPVAKFFIGIWKKRSNGERLTIRASKFSGTLGLIVRQNESIVAAMTFEIDSCGISQIFAVRNPDKLKRLLR